MKALIRLAATRPVGVTVLFLALALFGVVAFRHLAVDLFPAIDVPRISITTPYEGVSPEEVESLITRPLEQATSTIEGVDRIESTSSEGLSRVQLQFTWGHDLEEALDDVRVAVDRVRARLPEDAGTPTIYKFDLASVPVVFIGVTGSGDPRALKHLAEDDISRALERVPGVASVDVQGGQDREIRIKLDASRLEALSITADEVAAAIEAENKSLSAGDMRDRGREVVIRTVGEFQSPEEIEAVVVATRDGNPVQIRDVGLVVDTIRKVRSELYIDGEPGIRLRIYKQSGANTVEVADAVREELKSLNLRYEGRVELTMFWDSSEFIKSAVTNVETSAGLGALLAVLVLLLFLQNARATLVVATAIPLSIIVTFGLMHFAKMSLNLISFGGIALGVGMLVDGAIVILENIHRRRSEGLDALDAAVEGAREVGGPVVAGTLTTVAVFVPVVFVGGFAGVFFSEMALVVTFALLCSLVIALTLIPMLSARFFSNQPKPGPTGLSSRLHGIHEGIERAYGRFLGAVLDAPWGVVIAAIALLVPTAVLASRMDRELMPQTDEGRIDVDVELPVGTPLTTTSPIVRDIEKRVLSSLEPGELRHAVTSVGPEAWWRPGGSYEGEVDLTLVPSSERSRSGREIESSIHAALRDIPGAKIEIKQTSSNILTRILRHGDDRLSVEIRGHDIATSDALGEEVVAAMKDTPGVAYARASRPPGQLERVLTVDRARAAELGLSGADVANVVEHYVLGRVASRLRVDGDEYDIRVQLDEADREQLEQLPRLPVVTPTGQRVPLGSLVKVEARVGPSSLSRLDQERILVVRGGAVDRPISDVAADVRARIAAIPTPEGFSIRLGGEQAAEQDTFSDLMLGILLAVFLVYAAMAVQFESVLQPLVVMVSVPFAFIGVVGALLATGTTLNMNSILGTIVLVGIVVNNAIVLVDCANGLRRDHGLDVRSALVAAGKRRIRPILMTSLTTLLGLLPLAVGASEGSEIQAPLARAVVGGLFTSTLVTLALVPCVYLLVERDRAKSVRTSREAELPAPGLSRPAPAATAVDH